MSITLNVKYQDDTIEPLDINSNQPLHVLYVHVATLPPGISERLIYHDNMLLPDDNTKIKDTSIVDGDLILVYEFTMAQKAEYDTLMNTSPEPLEFIANTPTINRCRGLLLSALKQKPAVFFFVSDADKTEEMNMLAVKGDGDLVKRIPAPSEPVAIEAVKQDPNALRWLTDPTEATVIEALNGDGTILNSVPHDRQTPAMIAAAVAQNGTALQFTSPSLQTTSIVLTAVTNDGMAIEFANEQIIDSTIVTAAVTQNPYSISVLPKSYEVDDSIIAMVLNKAPKLISILDLRPN